MSSQKLVDSITYDIVKVMAEQPEKIFNKNNLAENAGVSRDALYRRWDSLEHFDIVREVETNSKHQYFKLNQDSQLTQIILKVMEKDNGT